MHHHNNTHTFIDSLLQSQHQFMQAMADHRDQLSETISSMAHSYLDTSIDRLKRFHDHVANDASGLKSDMLEATLKAAIDQHKHLKDRLTVHQHHANSYKQTLRRLAMGVMATFGVMSGVKAADAFESGQGNGGANSSTSTTQKATLGKSSLESRSQGTKSSTPYLEIMHIFNSSSPKILFDSLFKALIESKLSDEFELESLKSNINSHPKLLQDEKKILISLFNLNSPADIIKAANLVSNIRSEHTDQRLRESNHNKAEELFVKAANHPDATIDDTLSVGLGLGSLGQTYHDKAAELFVKAANHTDATNDDVNNAISFLRDLGPTYYAQADKLSDLANQKEAQKRRDAFESGQGNGGANSSTSTTQKATQGKSSIESGSQRSMKDLKAFFEGGSSPQSHATSPAPKATPTKPVMVSPQNSSKKQDEQVTPRKTTALPNAAGAMSQPIEIARIENADVLQIADALLNSPVKDAPAQGLIILQDLVQSENATPAILSTVAIKIMILHEKLATLTEQKSALEMASKLTDRIKAHPSADRNDKKKAEVAAVAIDRLISKLSSTPVAQGIPDVSMELPVDQRGSYEDAMNRAIDLINLGPENYSKAYELLINSASDHGGQPEHKIRAAVEIFKLHEKYRAEGKNDELTLETATALMEAANTQLRRVVEDKNTKPKDVLRTLELLRQFESPVFINKLRQIDYAGTEWVAYNALSNLKDPSYNRIAAEGMLKLEPNNHITAVEYYLKSAAPDRNPTSKDIKLAAAAVQKFGAEYKDAQANLWLSSWST